MQNATMATRITPEKYLSEKGAYYLLDVRAFEEFDDCHEEGASHIPLDELEVRMGRLPKNRKIAVICRSGGRSAHACELLSSEGFDICDIEGGMGGLIRAKLGLGMITKEDCRHMLGRL